MSDSLLLGLPVLLVLYVFNAPMWCRMHCSLKGCIAYIAHCDQWCNMRVHNIEMLFSLMQATVLCDRLGIFVDGQLVCIGNPKELTARYGGYYVSCMLIVVFLRFNIHGLRVWCIPCHSAGYTSVMN